jgi:uncharacterized membrane protein
VKRFPFLDWMRGLAVLIMIECHVFNSFTRLDLRDSGPYIISQFIGGLAAPLFLFMAGMTTGFQMESLERRESSPGRRWLIALRRGAFILLIAYIFRFTNWFFAIPHTSPAEMLKVDILNCMGLSMIVLASAAIFRSQERVRFTMLAGLAIIGAAPLVANLNWSGAPDLVRDYLVPLPNRGHFPFFPLAGYLAFGIALGTLVKHAEPQKFDRFMQWSVLIGFAMVFTAQYFSNLPFSVYPRSNFWLDSPALVVIRTGIILLSMAGAYLWTEYAAGTRWSWMQTLGKNSLMVYWVHVMIVYGAVVRPIKRALSIWQAALAAVAVTLMMVAMSAGWLWWKERKRGRKTSSRSSPDLTPARTRS